MATALPSSYVDGDTVTFTRTLPAHPIATHSAVLRFAGPEQFTVTATKSGAADYTFTMPSGKRAGLYAYQLVATRTADSFVETIGNGKVTIAPNLAATTADTFAATALADIETAIKSLASGTNESVSFNGQTFNKKDIAKLLVARDKLRIEAQAEADALQVAQGLGGRRRILTRFASSGYVVGSPYPFTR